MNNFHESCGICSFSAWGLLGGLGMFGECLEMFRLLLGVPLFFFLSYSPETGAYLCGMSYQQLEESQENLNSNMISCLDSAFAKTQMGSTGDKESIAKQTANATSVQ
jgi:hypothetical protein